MLRALVLSLAVLVFVGCESTVTSTSKNAFFEAIEDGNIRTVRMMVNATPSLLDETNKYGFTPLMRATSSIERTPKIVQLLVEAGANVNAKTDQGYTALHMMIDINGPTGTGVRVLGSHHLIRNNLIVDTPTGIWFSNHGYGGAGVGISVVQNTIVNATLPV